MILSELNPRQLAAVTHAGGPLAVVAGAGTGKTRVLTRRIAYLLEHGGMAPSDILAITFTNRATREMQERLARLVPHGIDDLWVSTIHSACVTILRRDAHRLGFPQDFSIYDQRDSMRVLKQLTSPAQGYTYDYYSHLALQQTRNAIGAAKSHGVTVERFAASATSDYWRSIADSYAQYQAVLDNSAAMDFDDLLLNSARLLREHPDVLAHWQRRFGHILVDEYQDTNIVQNDLVTMLAGNHRQVTVVGDTDQAIYGFRGAHPRNLEAFRDAFDDATTIVLDRNYRSIRNILDAANAIIRRLPNRTPKRLWTDAPAGSAIHYHSAADRAREAIYVSNQLIKRHVEDGVGWEEMAILYRMNSQSSHFERELRGLGIPHVVIGAEQFYGRDEVRDALALLKAANNPADDLHIKQALTVSHPRLARRVMDYIKPARTNLYSAMQSARDNGVSGCAGEAISQFCEMLDSAHAVISGRVVRGTRSVLSGMLRACDYTARFEVLDAVAAEERHANLSTLDQEINSHRNLQSFLAHVTTSTDSGGHDKSTPTVSLMTVHAAKGLEFNDVYVVGLQDGAFPHSRAEESPGGLSEERRLFYVAMTRAKQRLTLSYARTASIFVESRYHESPSPFIRQIPKHLIEEHGPSGEIKPSRRENPSARQYGRR